MSLNRSILSFLRTEPDQSPLLAIPPEIRHMIYEYVFSVDHIQAMQHKAGATRKTNNEYKELWRTYTMTFETRDRDNWRTVSQQLSRHLALAETCRELRAEIKLLPFSRNIFDVSVTSVKHFCTAVPKDILREIKVLSLYKQPVYLREYTNFGDPLELFDTDGFAEWWGYLKPLQHAMPSLKKVIVRICSDVHGLQYLSTNLDDALDEIVVKAVKAVTNKDVEVELV
jgi:hypothetical protein